MKKVFFVLVLVAMTMGLYSQNIKKGALLGLHQGEVTLNPGYTMEQYTTFLKEKLFPDFEKCFPGIKIYVLKGIRGECTGCYGTLYVFENEAARDKYFLPEGNMNETGKAALAKMDKKLNEEEQKMVKAGADKYIDWVVQ